MKTYQTSKGEILSRAEAMDILYDFRDVLETKEAESEDSFIFLPDHIEKKQIINAISSLLYHDSRKRRKTKE